jgi:undecaprenyl-diphosphatase
LLPALAAIGIAALLVAWFVPAWRGRAIFAVVLNLIAWKTSDVFKDVFHRLRPDQWVWHQEASFSYSSGHATDALVVFGLWSYFIWKSDVAQPWRGLFATALALWAIGVSWSRLALGVHYATDVLGGWLLGVVLIVLGFAVVDPISSDRVRRLRSD